MKLTQKKETVAAYFRKHPEAKGEIVQEKREETLEQNIRSSTPCNCGLSSFNFTPLPFCALYSATG